MGKSGRGVASVAILVGAMGTLLLADAGEAVGPSIRGYNQGGFQAPSRNNHNNSFSAPTPATLKRGGNSSKSSQSGPTTFGYWDGSSFVRTPAPWSAPADGFKGTNQRSR
jgi:hypothetical protein